MDTTPMPNPDEALGFLDSVVSTVHATRQDHVKMQQSLQVLARVVHEHHELSAAISAKEGHPLEPVQIPKDLPTPPPVPPSGKKAKH